MGMNGREYLPSLVLRYFEGTSNEKLVLALIADHDGPGGAWPGMPLLAAYSGLQVRSVRQIIQRLKGDAVVEVRINGGGEPWMRSDRRPNLYKIDYDHPRFEHLVQRYIRIGLDPRDLSARQLEGWDFPPDPTGELSIPFPQNDVDKPPVSGFATGTAMPPESPRPASPCRGGHPHASTTGMAMHNDRHGHASEPPLEPPCETGTSAVQEIIHSARAKLTAPTDPKRVGASPGEER